MKKIVLLILITLVSYAGWSQAAKKTTQQTKAVVTKPVFVNNNTRLMRLNSFKKVALQPLRMGTPQIQNIRPTSGSAGSSSTVISKSVARDKATKTGTTRDVEDGKYCTSSLVSEEKGEYEKIVLGNQNDKIYPGAIYSDGSIINGAYNAPTNLQLKPYQITSNQFSAASGGSSFIEVQPTLGNVYDGIAELMRRNTRVINPSSVAVEAEYVYSADQLSFFLQAGFQGYGVDLNAEFDYERRTKKNLVFVKLKQVYFTVTLNRPNGAALLENNPSTLPRDLVYVNKVNYGRIGIVKIESDSSVESIRAALDFTYNGNNVEVSLGTRLNYQRVIANCTVSGFFFGGDATNMMTINSSTGLSQFNDYIRDGLRLNPDVAPTAISYELKYVNDNSTAAINSTTSYTERRCETAKGISIVLNGISIEDIHGGDCSYAWGDVSVEVYELDNRGVQVRRVPPVTELLREEPTRASMWSYPRGDQPQRGMTNYADVRNNANITINNVNKAWNFFLDPEKVAANQIAIKVSCNINTNHKDNDIASLGFHGMDRVETRTYKLEDHLVTRQEISTKAKYGSLQAGPFASHSRSDRVHNFRAHFTITTAR